MNARKAKKIRAESMAQYDAVDVQDAPLWALIVVQINNLLKSFLRISPMAIKYPVKKSFKAFYRAKKRKEA